VRQIETIQDAGLMFFGQRADRSGPVAGGVAGAVWGLRLKYPAALNGPQFLAERSILKRPLVPVDGYLPVPKGPGLGVEVDEGGVREYGLAKL